ncbi:MAG: GFA family protein [Planctomycetota bacterium]
MRAVIGAVLMALLAGALVLAQADKANGKAVKRFIGRCHCGHVRYQVGGAVVKCSYCDCRGCQRATGTLKAPFVTVRASDLTVTAGRPTVFQARPKARCDSYGAWHFCPRCGTQVFWKPVKGNQVDLFAGTLEDTTIFQCEE